MPEQNVSTAQNAPGAALHALLRRLHFYVGVLVGPFLLVAALSGMLYALTPQIENQLYDHALHTDSQGVALSLEMQARAAQAAVGPDATMTALLPAPAQGQTTRVTFRMPGPGAADRRAIFIDPVNAEVRGDLTLHGSGDGLPLRNWIEQFHRGLLLGKVGRLYSELAASWLWVAALGGLILWFAQRRKASGQRSSLRRLHATTGLWLLIGLLFFSATGLTWSQWAGHNISLLRGYWGGATPSVSTVLGKHASMSMPMDEHAEHATMIMSAAPATPIDLALFDRVLVKARAENISAAKVEIRPATRPDKAWVVSEIDRRWPTRVDAIAINPKTLDVVDKVEFAHYPLAAKLTRWGIDAHMGLLFGLANQLILVAFASGLVVMVIWGYLMGWRRRPTRALSHVRQPTLFDAWRSLGQRAQCWTVILAVALGVSLPVMGCSLLGLIAWDLMLTFKGSQAALTRTQA